MRTRTFVLAAVMALGLTACGGDDDPQSTESTGDSATTETTGSSSETTDGGDSASESSGDASEAAIPDGPEIAMSSFNFGESVVLAQIYGQALEEAGYPVGFDALDLGAREFIYPDLEAGNISLLPEYVGSALAVGFDGEATADVEATLEELRAELEEIGATALEPAPAQNKNVFVVTSEFAEENDLTSVADLQGLGATLAGPPECEDRSTCYAGLVDEYGLDDLQFQTIQETPVRVSSLINGEVGVALLFSTDPVIAQEELVVLEDPQGLVAAENIVPVVSLDVIDAYGEDLRSLVNDLSEDITTELLIDLNGRNNEGESPADIAADFLSSR